ncbi:MAG: hypothetical protein K0Q63_3510 [Paenibacillus sp.]|nr:hypothetical protein [Paenibacillus sp.]
MKLGMKFHIQRRVSAAENAIVYEISYPEES